MDGLRVVQIHCKLYHALKTFSLGLLDEMKIIVNFVIFSI